MLMLHLIRFLGQLCLSGNLLLLVFVRRRPSLCVLYLQFNISNDQFFLN